MSGKLLPKNERRGFYLYSVISSWQNNVVCMSDEKCVSLSATLLLLDDWCTVHSFRSNTRRCTAQMAVATCGSPVVNSSKVADNDTHFSFDMQTTLFCHQAAVNYNYIVYIYLFTASSLHLIVTQYQFWDANLPSLCVTQSLAEYCCRAWWRSSHTASVNSQQHHVIDLRVHTAHPVSLSACIGKHHLPC